MRNLIPRNQVHRNLIPLGVAALPFRRVLVNLMTARARSSAVEHRPYKAAADGPTPSGPTKKGPPEWGFLFGAGPGWSRRTREDASRRASGAQRPGARAEGGRPSSGPTIPIKVRFKDAPTRGLRLGPISRHVR